MDSAAIEGGNPPPKRRRIVRKIKGNEGEGTESSGEECGAGKPAANQESYSVMS